MMSRVRLLIAPLAFALLACAGPATAQLPPPDGQRVQDAIEVTDRRIQHAQELLAQTPNAQAAAEVNQAVALQAMARTAFGEGRFAAAARATFDARIHADRAIALLRGLPDPGRVEEQMMRTREILDRARDALSHCNMPLARDLLRTALDMQSRAEQAYRETRYLAALQLTTSARERATRALRLCKSEESLEETVATALQRTDEVLARAHERLDTEGSEAARRLLANADALQARARAEAGAGRLKLALSLTRQSRDQATRAIRSSAPTGTS